MTEDEAKTKWCPMVRMIQHTSSGFVAARAEAAARCIGSACMMWRWLRETDRSSSGAIAFEKQGDHGFCGLGGSNYL